MLPPGLGALRERNLALLLGSTTISQLGTGISLVALAFAVLRIGDASDLGFVLLAREVPSVAFLLLGGVWADRVSRKWLLVGGDALSAAAQALTAGLFLFGVAAVWHVAVLQGIFGLALAFTRPATTGLVPDAVRSAHLQQANALLDLSRSSMRIAGPAVGALVVVASNPGWALALDAVTFAVSAGMRAGLRLTRSAERTEKPSVLADLRDGWREFISRTWVWVMVGTFGLFQLTLFPAYLVLGPVIANDELGGPRAWGAILAFQAAGSLLGGLAALRVMPRRPLVVSCLMMLPSAAVLAMLGAAMPTWAICVVGLFAGAALSISFVLWMTVLQQRVPPYAISRISSFDWLGSVALNPLGYALAGPVAGLAGLAATLYVAAAANVVVTLAAAFVPSIREVTATREAEPREARAAVTP